MAVRQLDWPFWKADLWALLLVAFNTDWYVQRSCPALETELIISLVAGGLTLVSLTAPM
jgi:hypothetical protein